MMSRTGLVLVGLMALLLALFHGACAAKGEGHYCAPSSCGNIRNISYPFRLKTDRPECGYQRLELACDSSNRTILYTCRRKYYVQGISYGDSSMRVVDASLDEKDSCSILHYSLTDWNFSCNSDPYHLPYEYNATVLMNCGTQAAKSSRYVDVTPCVGNSSSPKTNLYALYTDIQWVSDLHGHEQCRIEAIFPPLFSINSTTGGQLSILDIHHELSKGFDLWYYAFRDEYIPPTELWSFPQFWSGFQQFMKDLRYYLFTLPGYHNMFGDNKEFDYNGFPGKSITGRIASYIIKGIFIIARTSLGFLCFIALLIYKFRQRHLSVDDTIEEFFRSHNNFMPIRYSYSQIKEMTNGFRDKLGQGGFGSVYKGTTRSGHFVAVKVLATSKANGQDFITEVATIGRIHHVNVVRLVGFCVDGSKWALIYDFMANGSLDKFIFPKGENINPLSWERMYQIGLGVAQGIEYLHRGCEIQILHFDIKPHNILLDENFIPKVSDFGLAKLYSVDDSIVSLTAARGTLGYIAPELFYKNIGGVSYKADVYSFGMLLMEMVGKRKNVNAFAEHSSQIYFPLWVYDRISQGEDIEFGDSNEDEKKIARKMIIVALWCTQMNPVDRPSMSKVLEMLEGEIESLQMPPKPLLNPMDMSVVDRADNNPGIGGRPLSSYNDIGTITLDAR